VQVFDRPGELNVVKAPMHDGDVVAPFQQAVHDQRTRRTGAAEYQCIHAISPLWLETSYRFGPTRGDAATGPASAGQACPVARPRRR